jgi:hypothetical protein
MHELIANLHMHTTYSDGNATHAELAQAAIRCNLDVIITTDHNTWVNGPENYYYQGDQRVLLMVGEEIHDQARDPQKNHLLVFGVKRELSELAYSPQRLLDAVAENGGVSFLAHPDDPAAPVINETDITWVDWNVRGYTGIELWNAFSEFKPRIKTYLHALYYAFNPNRIARGPFEETLRRWDHLLAEGRNVVAIGGSDAHGLKKRLGPLRRTIFPYEFHFRAVNTHLLIPGPLTGDVSQDTRMVVDAFRQGHLFIGYDLPASTRGFHFIAQGVDKTAWMGDTLSSYKGITFQIKLPERAECHLLKDGKVIHTWQKRELCTFITAEVGVYRVEVYKWYKGRLRGWIFSNPIYVID